MTTSKICTKCKLTKELTEFNKCKKAADGHKSSCRECQKKDYVKYKSEYDTEKYLEMSRKNSRRHYQNHREEEIERNRVYRENNKEAVAKQRKKYQEENKEFGKAATEEWKRKNHDKHIANKKKWYMKNQEAQLKRRREYCQTPAGKLSDINASAKRRTMKRQSADGTIPLYVIPYPLTKELQELLETQNHKCNYCDCDISDGATLRHLDHIQPLSKGGTHSIDNVQWLCATCNLQKGAKVA